MIPELGKTSILKVTDKQYSEILNFWGKEKKALPDTPLQLEFF